MTLHQRVFFKIIRFQFFFLALRFRVLQVGLSDGIEEDGITHTMRGWHSLSFGRRGREGGATIWLPNNRAALRLGTRFSSGSGTSLSFFSFSHPSLFTNQSAIYSFFSMFVHSRLSLFASRTRRDLIHIERIV